jgi:hypothetical protein
MVCGNQRDNKWILLTCFMMVSNVKRDGPIRKIRQEDDVQKPRISVKQFFDPSRNQSGETDR